MSYEERIDIEQSELAITDLPPESLSFTAEDVHRYFSVDATLDLRDVVIYIRSICSNPWQRVIVESDIPLPVADLEGMRIYVRGKNEEKAQSVSGLGSLLYCPIRVDSSAGSDFGILNKLAEYTTTYNLTQFEILIYGDDVEALQGAWEYLQSHADITQRTYFPATFTDSLKLFDNGIDIAPYAKKLAGAHARNSLTSSFLSDVMDSLRQEVKSGKIYIQDFEETRSVYAKWLTMCLTQEFRLPPVYLTSYIAEYINMQIAYPFEKLSFYERLMFLKNLPTDVGYVAKNQEIACLFHVVQKVYPNPYIAFDLATGEVIFDDVAERFKIENLSVLDYRTMFSQVSESKSTTSLSKSGTTDEEIDRQLVGIFTQATAASPVKDLYMSVRNTAIVSCDGHQYLLYFTEPFGVGGFLQSDYFGRHVFMVTEDDFHRLIDSKVILADMQRQAASTPQEGQEQFTAIMRLDTQFRPAVDTYTLMCAELSRYLASDLSYYDKRLRCDRCVLPIVTHVDSGLSAKRTVFDGTGADDHISLLNLRYDKMGSQAITAFGGLNSSIGVYDKIPVSTETFRGCKLL